MYVKIWGLFHKKLDSNKKITNKGVDAIGSKQVWVITGIWRKIVSMLNPFEPHRAGHIGYGTWRWPSPNNGSCLKQHGLWGVSQAILESWLSVRVENHLKSNKWASLKIAWVPGWANQFPGLFEHGASRAKSLMHLSGHSCCACYERHDFTGQESLSQEENAITLGTLCLETLHPPNKSVRTSFSPYLNPSLEKQFLGIPAVNSI